MATFSVQGSLLLTTARLLDDEPAFVLSSGVLPAPLVATVPYYVRDAGPGSLALAETPGGAPIVLSTEGTGVHVIRAAVVPVTASELWESIADWFALEGAGVSVAFGWRAPTYQTNQGGGRANRIVLVPGDADGKAGRVMPGRHGGRDRRQAATFEERVTARVWGSDPARPNDERAQYEATRDLFDRMVLALRAFQTGRVEVGEPKWTIVPIERSFGRELVATLTLDSPVLRRQGRTVLQPPALEPTITATAVFVSSEVEVFPIA